MPASQGSALIIGVGPRAGVGGALCRRFGAGGYHVVPVGRTEKSVAEAAEDVIAAGGSATPMVADATSEQEMIALFDRVEASVAPLEVVAYNAGNNRWHSFLEMEADFFESAWRVGCFGGFLAGREAARRMVPRNKGTILFTGATASLRGRPPLRPSRRPRRGCASSRSRWHASSARRASTWHTS